MSSLSRMDKPSLIVIIRSGGGACCARHVMDEKHLYDKTLKKLKKKLGAKLGTEIPVPRYQDLIHLHYGSSAGNVVSSALAMGKTLDDVVDWWPKIGPDIVPIAEKKRQLIFKQGVSFLQKYAATTNPNPSVMDGRITRLLARAGARLTSIFAANENLLRNDGWDKHLQPLGFFDKTMTQSDVSIIYGAHHIEGGKPIYLGFIRPELLSAEYVNGLLLNGTDISHASALKGATAIPFIFQPVEVAPGTNIQDMATVDAPHNFMSWLALDVPLSPRFGSIKVIHMGSGDRFEGSDPAVFVKEGPMADFYNLHKNMRNHVRRAAFATISRSVREFNRVSGSDPNIKNFYNLDIPDNGRDFADTSEANILEAMDEDAELSRLVNAGTFEELSTLLADNYIREYTMNRAMQHAYERVVGFSPDAVQSNITPEKRPRCPVNPDIDINSQMGSYGPASICHQPGMACDNDK